MPAEKRELVEIIVRSVGTDIDDLLSAIQIVFNCTPDDLKSRRNDNSLPYARRIFFYYANKIFSKGKSLSKREIGLLLNRKSSDVFYNIRAFKQQNDKKTNIVFYRYVKRVTEMLNERWFIIG
jgi:chromosomal replication initiation ATPase DnaA